MINEIEGDSVTENAVEDQVSNPVLNEHSLAKMFMAETEADTQEESEVNNEVEQEAFEEPEVEEPTEELVAETDEDMHADFREEEAETKEEEAEEGDVLSKQDKSLKKMRKRIDKATKRFKTAEEAIQSKEKEIESLKEQLSSKGEAKSSGEQSFKDITSEADSISDLQAVYDKAEQAEEWIEDALDQLRDSGEDSLVVNEREYSRQEIKSFHKEIKQALKKDIPARAKMLEQRQQYDEYALKEFPFLGDPESDGYKQVETVMQNSAISNAFDGLAEQSYIYGLLGEGLLSRNARQTQQSQSGMDKTKDTVKKPVSTQKAPSVPFVRSNVAGTRKTSSEKTNQVKREIMNRKSIGTRELTKLFM